MDLFVKNLETIKSIALELHFLHGKRYEVNELVNAAYLGYKRAITNNPSLIEGKFSRITTFFFRVKSDMKDYIRDETKKRIKDRMENKGVPVPNFLTNSFQAPKEEDQDFFEPSNTEYGYEEYEISDFLDRVFMEVHLDNDEWDIIQGYFYDEKTLKEVGKDIGLSEGRVCKIKKDMLNKIQPTALRLREAILK